MIEVNLLPGAKKRAGGGGGFSISSLSMPSLEGLPTGNSWVLGSGAVVLVLVAAAAFLYLSRSGAYSDLETEIEELAADSADYADLIEQTEVLRARRDSIAERVDIIQEIDRDRYTWPHIMDEVARALPDYTWLTSLVQTSIGEELRMRLEGLAGTNFALTTFMENLEASPYIRGVTLVSTQLTVQSDAGVSRTMNAFTLQAAFENQPLDFRETVPLFQQGGAPPVEPVSGQAPAESGAAGADSDS